MFDRKRQRPCDGQTDGAADEANAPGFDEKLQQNRAAFCADGLAHADFARSFGDGNEHDVHDADAADK